MLIAIRKHRFEVLDNDMSWWWYNQIGQGVWENSTLDALELFLKKDKDMIDVGAWIFPISLYSSRLCNKVFAIEPEYNNFKEGISNIKLNNIENIIPINIGLWTTTGIERIKEMMKEDSSTFSLSSSGQKIKTLSFEDFGKQNDLSNVNLVKMDIEGAEGLLLGTMKKWLHENKITLILSTHVQFKRDKKSYYKLIESAIKEYPFVYKIDFHELLCTYEKIEVNKKWQIAK